MKRIEDGHTDLVFEYVAEGENEAIAPGWLLSMRYTDTGVSASF